MLYVFLIISYDCIRTLYILLIIALCYMLILWVIRFFVYYLMVYVICKLFNGLFDMFLVFFVLIKLYV